MHDCAFCKFAYIILYLRIVPQVAESDVEEFIQQEVDSFAPMQPRPLSMQEVLDMLDPQRIAKFLHVEVPIRMAERIRWIREIENWQDIPELVEIEDAHVHVFRDFRMVQRKPTLDAFTAVVERAMQKQEPVRLKVALAMHRLHTQRGDDFTSEFIDPWLDNFLLNCIGTEMLMSQYLACVIMESDNKPQKLAGIVDPDCDVAQICRETAMHVQEITEEHTGRTPKIEVKEFQDKAVPRFSYIPGFLRFIMTEVLKNSCRATAEVARSDREVQKRPIEVIVCADDHEVAIRVCDRARGIPFGVGQKVWSYLYTTAGKGKGPTGKGYADTATSLAGYGIGLPLSRLYARYFGGSLKLVSLPGYGTSVDLFLRRVNANQVEIVPDNDAWKNHSLQARGQSTSQRFESTVDAGEKEDSWFAPSRNPQSYRATGRI